MTQTTTHQRAARLKKRDGSIVPFDSDKIRRAVLACLYEVCDRSKPIFPEEVDAVVNYAVECIAPSYVLAEDLPSMVDIETVQDKVVEALAAIMPESGAAEAYQHYRESRKALREVVPDPNAIGEYVRVAKYARYNEAKQRRETWPEVIGRVKNMHLDYYSKCFHNSNRALRSDVFRAFEIVEQGLVFPSARSLQFGGKKIMLHNAAMFNCTSSYIDRVDFYKQAHYLLLCGCGVGASVQRRHIKRLPPVKRVSRHVRHFSIPDSIEGWAEATHVLMESHLVHGEYVEFDYSCIRDEGLQLRLSGGKAPGHIGLRESLETMREMMERVAGRQLKSIELADLLCVMAESVLSGGVRRSSLWIGFDASDGEMMTAKTGDWMTATPWRKNSNNSAYCVRGETTRDTFERIVEHSREWGDPGFYFASSPDHVPNPCVEIGMRPSITTSEWAELGRRPINPSESMHHSGFSFCNLTEIVLPNCDRETFLEACWAASFIGTLQAGYTSFPFLGGVTEAIARRDALLGVSITGLADARWVLDKGLLEEGARIVNDTNVDVARNIGIRPAARTTCVKPSGTLSLATLGGPVGSGVHPHESKRILRRIIANHVEAPFLHLQRHNPQAVHRKSDWSTGQPHPTDNVITFPVLARKGAQTWDEVTAMEFLRDVLQVLDSWVKPGTIRRDSTVCNAGADRGLSHNVSCTCKVRDDEWDDVLDFLWDNRDSLAAVALFADHGVMRHPDVPRQPVTEADESEWRRLVQLWRPVDYKTMVETEDTGPKRAGACEGDSCEV